MSNKEGERETWRVDGRENGSEGGIVDNYGAINSYIYF